MPIEIRELHIRINVNEGGGSGDKSKGDSSGGKSSATESLEQVLEIIKKQKER